MRSIHRRVELVLLSLIALAGCKDSSHDKSQTTTTSGAFTIGETTISSGLPPAGAPTNDVSPAARISGSLTDSQILQVLREIAASQRSEAMLAQSHSTDTRVKSLAATILTEQADFEKRAIELATTRNLTLAESALGLTLRDQTDRRFDDMRTKGDSDFDRTFTNLEAQEQQDLLDVIDVRLVPDAQDPDVKSLVRALRVAVAAHVDEARRIQSDLAVH